MDIFSGKQLHSHNYRHPQQFKDQRVAIFGISASGADIAREIASQASQVYWCGDTFNNLSGNDVTDPNCENIHLFSCPTGADSKGRITFKQNRAQKIDTFIFATGYHYDFPFLKMDPCISVNDNYISPLYQQIISAMCPNIGFIGIPFLVIPFPFFEIQARWFSNVLKQNIALPTTSEMIAIVEAHEKELQKNERKKRLYHQLGTDQDAYLNALLFEMGESSVPEWVTNLMEECRQVRTEHPDSFRDETYINHGPSKLPY